MSIPSLALWLLKAQWAYPLAGRWTLLLILAWIAHMAVSRHNPRWRVLIWRSTAVGLATIAILIAVPPILTLQLPFAEPNIHPAPTSVTFVPVSDHPPAVTHDPAQVVEPQTSTAETPRPPVSVKQVNGGPAVARNHSGLPIPGIGPSLLAIWLAGATMLAFRLALSVRRLSSIVRRATDVPTEVADECGVVAKALGYRRTIRVVQTAEIPAPCLAGLFQPWLLLPTANCDDSHRADLRAILAHEFAHARGRDLVWNAALHVWSIILWFHPFAWRVRSAHLAACDAVCDALAADFVGDFASYSRTLARLALQVARRAPVPGLAMARTPNVLLRIQALQRTVFRKELRRRLIVPALLAFAAAVVLIGGSRIMRADQPPARKATDVERNPTNATPTNDATAPASIHRLSIRALSAQTGEPLDKVSMGYEIRGESQPHKKTLTTDQTGTATIEWPSNLTVHALHIDVKKPGFVPLFLYWDDRNHALSVPASHEARLEAGVPIRGVVQDEAGKPISQASVTAMATATEGEECRYVYSLETTRTDDQGRWHIDDAPADISGVSLHVRHPDYRQSPGMTVGGRELLTTLEKGASVKGRVIDESGKPVKGAQVDTAGFRSRDQRQPSTSNERGEYTLRNREAGPAVITAQAEGFAPELVEVTIANRGEATAPDIRLGKPRTLRVKVVDRAGKPVAGASLGIDTWRGHRSPLKVRPQTNVEGNFTWIAQTDVTGRVVWTTAPSDPMLFSVFKDGFMRKDLLSLTASDEEHVVTLGPELIVSGSVTDAVTGNPVPKFRVIPGFELEEGQGFTWWRMGALEYTGERYSMKFDTPRKGSRLRIEAPRYERAESRPFRSNEGAMIQDFLLKPATEITGVVLLPDGRPAADVEVVLATRKAPAFVRDGVIQKNSSAETTATGPDGRLAIPKHEGTMLLVVAAGAGFADMTSDEFARTGKLVLQPWRRIEGEARIGPKLAAYQSLAYIPEFPSGRGEAGFMRSYDYYLKADSRGRFAIDRVIPGRGHIARVLDTTLRGGWSGHTPVEVKPGQTTQIRFGGQGRTVTGRVVLVGTPAEPVDWRSNDDAVLQPPRADRIKATTLFSTFASGFDDAGKFRINDVPPGAYELNIPVNLPSDRRTWGEPRAKMGEAKIAVAVPEGPEGQPIDLGDIKARLYLRVGDLAPDFTAPRLDGGQFTLSQQRGKLVLLDFWATWCIPCLAEMPSIKDIQQTFGADPRFMLVGLSCDDGVERPAGYAKANALTWTQALAGKMLEGEVSERYLLRAIPATFLIGLDGRVLAMNLRGAPLKEAVRKALSDEKLFSIAK